MAVLLVVGSRGSAGQVVVAHGGGQTFSPEKGREKSERECVSEEGKVWGGEGSATFKL